MPERSKSRVEGQIIRPFDPWGSEDCTCAPKLTFNPYTGCAYGCLYCYITSYIPRAFEVRTKKDVDIVEQLAAIKMAN